MDKHPLPSEIQGSENVQVIRLFAICGMSSIGKTDLIVEYAHSRTSKFGAIFWIEGGGVSQLASDLAGLQLS